MWHLLHHHLLTSELTLSRPSMLRALKVFSKRFGSAFTLAVLLEQHFAKGHMKWTFNLEKAPWWGGVFERLVKSVRRCLKKTISGVRLTYEELLTVIIEVEMVLNCRPLSYVSSEEPLTPSQLLSGQQVMSLPDSRSSEAEDSDTDVQPQDLDQRMCHLSNVMNHFWKRWRNKYLLELQNSYRKATQHSSN